MTGQIGTGHDDAAERQLGRGFVAALATLFAVVWLIGASICVALLIADCQTAEPSMSVATIGRAAVVICVPPFAITHLLRTRSRL